MNHYIEEAITITKEASERICSLVDQYADSQETENMGEAQSLYQLAAELQVKTSQLTDCKEVYEGACHVNNLRATVEIGGYEIRGKIAFEIQKDDGTWIKGHRDNSQYGQVFAGNDGSSVILSDEIHGRVTHPLQMD